MKCLTNEQLQRLIDGEILLVRSEQYEAHIASCLSCQERYNEQKALAKSITGLINEIVQSQEPIPEFKIPLSITKTNVKVRWIPLWTEVAAVIIPLIFICKMANKPDQNFKPSAENIRMYELCNDVDANTAFQENMIITTVTDDKGDVIECSTN